MIRSKQDLKYYLSEDMKYTPPSKNFFSYIKNRILKNEGYYLHKYLVVLRYMEFYKNTQTNFIRKIMYFYYFIRWKRLNYKTGMEIPANCCGPGLRLFHTINARTAMTPESRLGARVILRPGVVLGYQGDATRETLNSPVVEDEVEFSWGAKAFGKVRIGRGSLINTNCVVMTNIPPYAIVVGNPGKIIGFSRNPDEIIEYEEKKYPVNDRLPRELLEKNYQKYFISRINEIKKIINP